ncbi:hypothetical protein [Tateyamaria sp.]|uniref:hypothetical protein n=1 Tax=Tateyamaria sp. TaxID=1929288 RepID=UPI0032A141A5
MIGNASQEIQRLMDGLQRSEERRKQEHVAKMKRFMTDPEHHSLRLAVVQGRMTMDEALGRVV